MSDINHVNSYFDQSFCPVNWRTRGKLKENQRQKRKENAEFCDGILTVGMTSAFLTVFLTINFFDGLCCFWCSGMFRVFCFFFFFWINASLDYDQERKSKVNRVAQDEKSAVSHCDI